MFSPSDFNDAVPQFTNGNYASTPLNPLYVEEPGAIDYSRGVEPLQTLPAQWWNWLGNQFTSKLNKINIYVKNVFDELTQLLALLGITPDATEGAITTNQLKTAFETKYPKFVADKPPVVKVQNEVLSSGTDGRYNVDNTVIKYASTANITPLYGIQTVDGETPTDGDYILVKDQTDATENGLYEYNTLGDWNRVTGFTTPADLLKKIFSVESGNTNAGIMFYLSDVVFENGTAFGTDDINFIQYFGSQKKLPNTVAVRDSTGHVKTADPVEADDAVNLGTAALALYPVGSIYWTGKAPNDGGDPNVLFGGTWVQIKDKFVLAAGDTYSLNGTGGVSTVTLNSTNMPAHSHSTISQSTSTTGNDSPDHTHGYSVLTAGPTGGYPAVGNSGIADASTGGASTRHAHNFSHTHEISNAYGDSQGNAVAHENMPPYVVKYCWERTA